jgi:FMN phosphatase YigB (HAD superfamily)
MKNQRIPRTDTPLLPIQRTVIFVDWHGVTSSDVFWSSIVQNVSHRYFAEMKNATSDLFANDRRRVLDWMRGSLDYKEIVGSLRLPHALKSRADYLERLLIKDCLKMTGNVELLERLRHLKNSHYVVLATDNMDCFSMVVDKLPWVRATFDALICSSEIGVTKAEDIASFFNPWLSSHGLGFKDALLLDDSQENCSKFRSAGGRAVQVTEMSSALKELDSLLELSPV